MYKVTCNGKIIHSDALNGLKVKGGKLALELGKTGLFEFTIYSNHPYYENVVPMRSIVEVFKDNESIFRGRVLNIQYGFYNEKQVTCEGELAFLLDSIVPAHTYNGSFGAYLDYVIGIHNGQVEAEKKFQRGNVTVADFAPFNVTEKDFISSFETLNKKMIERTGGFLQARHENGTMYLDLLAPEVNANNVAVQKIRLGKNLIDIKREVEGGEVFSCIIPLGAEVNGKRVDISSINDGYYSLMNSTAVSAYGKIFKTVIFDNITSASALLSEARNYLTENYAAINTVEITAVDLSEIDFNLDSFRVGQWVTIESAKHFNQSQTLLIRKMTINLDNPADTKIEVGRTKQGLTDSLGNVTSDIDGVMASINNVAGSVGNAVTKAETAETKATNATTVANNAVTTANSAVTAVNNVSSRVSAIETEPHITATGTNGIWTWKKYSDNTCEFFGRITISNYSVTTALGTWFSGANLYGLYDVIYPFTLKEAPVVTITLQSTNNTSAVPWVFSNNATTAISYLPQCYLIRPTSVTGLNGFLNIIVKGKF